MSSFKSTQKEEEKLAPDYLHPVCDAIKNKQKCVQFERLMEGLIFYESLDLNKNEDEDKMSRYLNERYVTFLDDFIHIITKHDDEYNNAYIDKVGECDLSRCFLAMRHQRDRRKDGTKYDIYCKDKKNEDDNILFYKDVLDSAHCYFCHLYHFALRVKINADHIEKDGDDDPLFDAHFHEIQKIIKRTKAKLNKLKHFDFARYKTNKFKLNVAQKDDEGNLYLFIYFRTIYFLFSN